MLELNLVSVEVIGILASFVAGLFSLIPALGATDSRRAAVAIIVLIFAVLAQNNFTFATGQAFITALSSAAIYAVVSYKLLLQPFVLPATNTILVSMGVLNKNV